MATRSDYELIAAALKARKPISVDSAYYDGKTDEWNGVVNALSRAFASESASFKPEVFIRACGAEV